jgi:hypothetical protein
LKDQGVDGRMGSKWTSERLAGAVEWILLAQNRDLWRAVVDAVMNIQVLAPCSWLVSQSLTFLHGLKTVKVLVLYHCLA